jgi:hypothetical protein
VESRRVPNHSLGAERQIVASASHLAPIVDSNRENNWIVSRRFDLLFLVNVWWLLAWAGVCD